MNFDIDSQDSYWANISKLDSSLYTVWLATRNKDYRKFLNDYISQLPAERILDVGSGIGLNVRNLKRSIVCCDLDFGALNFGKNMFSIDHWVNAASTNLPFKDNSFDLILISMLFNSTSFSIHRQMIKELCRCSNRYILLSEPFSFRKSKIVTKKNIWFILNIFEFIYFFMKEGLLPVKLIRIKKSQRLGLANFCILFVKLGVT